MLSVNQQGYFPKAHGFFSCCSLRLEALVSYFIQNHRIPDNVDCTNLFIDYKTNEHLDNRIDISHFFFYYSYEVCIPENSANIQNNVLGYHVLSYKDIPFIQIIPFIKKFFIPSSKILNKISYIEEKYNLNPENAICVYYRGTDKCNETQLGGYDVYLEKCKSLLNINPEMTVIVQTDEVEFENYFLVNSPTNKLIILKELGYERNYEQGETLLAITSILSKCHYIICSSSNVSVWMTLFRGNAQNVYQYLNGGFFF
jgi:hypothetical protein